MGHVLNVHDVGEAVRMSDAAVRRALAVGAERGAERGRSFIVRQTPVDQGQLKASWRVLPRLSAAVKAGSQVLAELMNDAPHAGIVERGARRHSVSPEGWMAIYDWVMRHRAELGIVTASGAPKRARKSKAPIPSAVGAHVPGGGVGLDPQVAYVTSGIVFKLRQRGQKATYFVRDSLEALRSILDTEVRGAVDRALRSKLGATGGGMGSLG